MHNIIMNTILILVPIVVAVFSGFLFKQLKTADNMDALLKLVDAGVVFAEKTGVVKDISGSEQFKVAYQFVQNQLAKLGITSADEQLIKALIEKSWAQQYDHLKTVYSGTQTEVKEDNLTKKEAELKQKEADIVKEKEQVKNTINLINQAINQTNPDSENKGDSTSSSATSQAGQELDTK